MFLLSFQLLTYNNYNHDFLNKIILFNKKLFENGLFFLPHPHLVYANEDTYIPFIKYIIYNIYLVYIYPHYSRNILYFGI